MSDPITIRIGRKLAMTAGQLAAELGQHPSSVRATLSRRGIRPAGHIDGRTPIWLAAPTLTALGKDESPGAS